MQRWIALCLSLLLPSFVAAQPAKKDAPADDAIRIKKGIEYAKWGERSMQLDLYVPKSDAPLPLMVWIHGGGWKAGSKDQPSPALRHLARGYAVAHIAYRFSQEAIFPAQIEDCRAAIRWLRANAKDHGYDPERIGVWGASAGGHLALLLGCGESIKGFDKGPHLDVDAKVLCVCDWFGPTDLWTISEPVIKAKQESPLLSSLIGGPIASNKEKLKKASPTNYVTSKTAPVLMIHGDKDPLVPLSQSEQILKQLKECGVECRLHVVANAGHGGLQFLGDDVNRLQDEFFDRHLKGKK
jgi:acetyl esterase/lipase